MLYGWWDRLQSWCDATIEQSAVRRLSRTVNGRAIKSSIPPVFAFCVAAAFLVGQLSMLRWPESFSAFLLASPAVAVLLMSLLMISSYPSASKHVPTYAVGAYGLLAAIQCIMGAFAMLLPLETQGSSGYRLIFAVTTTLFVLGLTFGFSKNLVHRTVDSWTQKDRRSPEPEPEESEEEDDEG